MIKKGEDFSLGYTDGSGWVWLGLEWADGYTGDGFSSEKEAIADAEVALDEIRADMIDKCDRLPYEYQVLPYGFQDYVCS